MRLSRFDGKHFSPLFWQTSQHVGTFSTTTCSLKFANPKWKREKKRSQAASKANVKVKEVVGQLDKPRLKLKLIGDTSPQVPAVPTSPAVNLPPQPLRVLSELEQAWLLERKLKKEYYDAVDAEDSVRWFYAEELKGIYVSSMTKWIKTPLNSPNRKFGLMAAIWCGFSA